MSAPVSPRAAALYNARLRQSAAQALADAAEALDRATDAADDAALRALAAGLTYEQVGQTLGLSKQAAHHRYATTRKEQTR